METRPPGQVAAAPRHEDADDAEQASDGQPVGKRPEERGHEVAVAVHVGVGIGSDFSEKSEAVLEAVTVKDRDEDEKSDYDAVAEELVRNQGLYAEGKERVDDHLGEGDEIELLEILQELVVV